MRHLLVLVPLALAGCSHDMEMRREAARELDCPVEKTKVTGGSFDEGWMAEGCDAEVSCSVATSPLGRGPVFCMNLKGVAEKARRMAERIRPIVEAERERMGSAIELMSLDASCAIEQIMREEMDLRYPEMDRAYFLVCGKRYACTTKAGKAECKAAPAEAAPPEANPPVPKP